MARVDFRLVLAFLVIGWMVVLVSCADNSTTTPATPTTTPTPPKREGILETVETFISAIPEGIAKACEVSAKAVEDFFSNPWW